MAFSFDLGLAISAERYGAISAGPEQWYTKLRIYGWIKGGETVGEEQKWIRDIQRRGSWQAAVKTRYYRLMALLGLSVVLTLAACGFTVVLSQFSGGGIGWGKWLISGWKKDRTGS